MDVEVDESESKKTRTETALEEPHTPQPLTEENLTLLQGLPAMSQQKSGNGIKAADSSSCKVNIGIDTWTLLRSKHLSLDDKTAFDRLPEMKANCEELLARERHSGTSEDEHDRILNDLHFMMEVNDDTFIDLLWPVLIRDVRQEHHLARVRNQTFNSNSIPFLDTGYNKFLKDLLLSLPQPEAPKPSYCFGLREEAFTPEERMLNDRLQQYTVLSKSLYHCFFAVEFETLDSEWGQCQTRCRRAGDAMVCATEKLLRLASPDEEQPLKYDQLIQEPCMAFTLAVNQVIAKLNVHWAESYKKGTIYHMHNMRSYFMDGGEHLKDLRHDVNCILDWGCVDRKTSIQETLAKIKVKHDSMPTLSLTPPSLEGGKESAADENWEHLSQAVNAPGA